MAIDLNTLQMLSLYGGANSLGMEMAQRASIPRINPTNYMEGYEQRAAIRQALHPQVRGGRVSQAISGAMGGVPPMGGGMDASSIVNPGIANATLAPYGLQLPTHTNPFLFFQDQNADGSPTWAGNHPKAAKAIEGAMIGAANTGQGQTVGENISNVARSVLGIPGMYRNAQAAQMAAPFDMAAQINGLQTDQANLQEKLATAYHLNATGRAALDKPTKSFSGQVYQDSTNRPYQINQVTGTPAALDGRKDPLQFTGSTKVGTPTRPVGTYPKGVSTIGEKSAYNEMIRGHENDPTYDPRSDPNWNNRVMYWQGRNAAATGGAGAGARNAANQGAGALSQVDDKKLEGLKQNVDESFRLYNEGSKLTPSEVRGLPGDTFEQRKQNELAKRKQAWTDAKNAYQNALNGASQGISSGGNRVQSTGHAKPRVTIQGDKIVVE